MNSPQDFDKVAKSAAAEASATRHELGPVYAAEFLKNPEKFDPRKLMTLGRAGLSTFVATVGVPTIELAKASDEPSVNADADDERGGWEEQRIVPMAFEVFGLLLGVGAGVGIIAATTLVVIFF